MLDVPLGSWGGGTSKIWTRIGAINPGVGRLGRAPQFVGTTASGALPRRRYGGTVHGGARRNLVFPSLCGQEWPVRPIVQVAVHASQFPENVQRALLTSLKTRQINHKFLYDSIER